MNKFHSSKFYWYIHCTSMNHDQSEIIVCSYVFEIREKSWKNPEKDREFRFWKSMGSLLVTKISMPMGAGSKRRFAKLQPIHKAFDENLAAGLAIPRFHRLGYHETNSLRKGKQTCWNLPVFKKSKQGYSQTICTVETHALSSRCHSRIRGIWLCSIFAPKMNIKNLGHLRWHLFKKAETEKLPPTKAVLKHL